MREIGNLQSQVSQILLYIKSSVDHVKVQILILRFWSGRVLRVQISTKLPSDDVHAAAGVHMLSSQVSDVDRESGSFLRQP